MTDERATARSYAHFFDLSDDAAQRAAARRAGDPEDTLASDERWRLRVKRINDYIRQCRERRNGR